MISAVKLFGWITSLAAIRVSAASPPFRRQRRLPPLTVKRLQQHAIVSAMSPDEEAMSTGLDEQSQLAALGEQIAQEASLAFNQSVAAAAGTDISPEASTLIQKMEEEMKKQVEAVEQEAVAQVTRELAGAYIIPFVAEDTVVAEGTAPQSPPLVVSVPSEKPSVSPGFWNRSVQVAPPDDFRVYLPLEDAFINTTDMNNGTFYFGEGPIDIRMLLKRRGEEGSWVENGQSTIPSHSSPIANDTIPGSNIPWLSSNASDLAYQLTKYLGHKTLKPISNQCVRCQTCNCVDSGQCIEFEESLPASNFFPTHGIFKQKGVIRLCQNDGPFWMPLGESYSFRQMSSEEVDDNAKMTSKIESDEEQWPDDDSDDDPDFENDSLDTALKKVDSKTLVKDAVEQAREAIGVAKKRQIQPAIKTDFKVLARKALIEV
eukprot:Blabericola_migrator_1__1624@NODE_1435_length_4552_cov_77_189967_g954_i0_p1_GENE_NODE_1435_length_4552_cov_77_189967_g954_i0NODE_1435_length_4552_cov_77_189967_g954_i0_p1_ORF_typecomplete_len430_score71_90ETF_QO/PF05187_13/0_22DUF2284/PF10050_9/4_5e02DUF2284/PF10050_9/0_75DUF3618/PF12277_8/3_8e03DUF3618/PF12277_8/0_17_NODE_1435_length_4552_cov_77_189967_g954_i07122001